MHRYLAGAAFLAALALGSCDGSTGPEVSDLILSSSAHDFGVVNVGAQSTPVVLTVTNGGSAANMVASVRLSGASMAEFAVASDECTATELGIQGTCQVAVRLKPSTSGRKEATLTVTDRRGSSTTTSLVGLANGVALRVNATTDFQSVAVGSQGESRAVRITNAGAAPTGPLVVQLTAGDVADFPIVGDACAGIQLPPAADCLVTIRFSPSAGGRRTATIRVSGDPGGAVASTLTGLAGTPVSLTASPAARDLGATNVGSVSDPMAFTITNTGTSPTGTLSARTTGDASDRFRIPFSTCVGHSLPAAASCQVHVVFEPTAAGPRSAVLRVEDQFGSMASAELTASGEVIILAAHPAVIDFPGTMAGLSSAPVTVTVTNTGTGTSAGLLVYDSGCGYYDYDTCNEYLITDDLCTENALAPGASCTFALIFRPSDLATDFTNINIAASGVGAHVQVSGTATGLHVPVQQVDFAPTPVGSTSAVETITVTNTGSGPTGPISTVLALADFEVMSNGCAGAALAAGGSCTLQVRFRARTAGLVQGSIVIAAAPGGSREVTLRGTGT